MPTLDEQVSMTLMFMFMGVFLTLQGVNFFVAVIAAGVAGFLNAIGLRTVKVVIWHLAEWLGLHN